MKAVKKLLKAFTQSDIAPHNIEVFLLLTTFIIYTVYLGHVIIDDNSRFVSLAALFISGCGIAFAAVNELRSRQRWWIVVYGIVLVSMITFIFRHKWAIVSKELMTEE